MNVLRGIVFPALRLILWTVIAVSLAWLAFGRGDPGTDSVATPSFAVSAPEVEVSTGTVENVVSLPGTVSADPAAAVRATAAGEVSRLRVRLGDEVEQGTPLLDIVTVEEPVTEDPETAEEPRRTTTVIRAAGTGTVTTLDVLREQQVAVGDTVATVSPGTLTVTASLTQEQQFRLLTPPTVADVTVPGGPAPFSCTDVEVGQPPSESTPTAPDPLDPYAVPSGPATGSVTCRVPDDATVFAGMSATVDLQAGVATNVLVLPVTAVQGSVSTGTVWVLGPDGDTSETAVTLGLNDGEQVEIRTGVAAGDRVLQFVPNSDIPDGDEFGPGGAGIVYGPGG